MSNHCFEVTIQIFVYIHTSYLLQHYSSRKRPKKSKMQNELSAKNNFTQFLPKTIKKSQPQLYFAPSLKISIISELWKENVFESMYVYENIIFVICSQSSNLILV